MQTGFAIAGFAIGSILIVIDLILSLNTPVDQSYFSEEDLGYHYREGSLFVIGIIFLFIGWFIYD